MSTWTWWQWALFAAVGGFCWGAGESAWRLLAGHLRGPVLQVTIPLTKFSMDSVRKGASRSVVVEAAGEATEGGRGAQVRVDRP